MPVVGKGNFQLHFMTEILNIFIEILFRCDPVGLIYLSIGLGSALQ